LPTPVATTFPTPTLRKVREGWGTLGVWRAEEIKSLGQKAITTKDTKLHEGTPRGFSSFNFVFFVLQFFGGAVRAANTRRASCAGTKYA